MALMPLEMTEVNTDVPTLSVLVPTRKRPETVEVPVVVAPPEIVNPPFIVPLPMVEDAVIMMFEVVALTPALGCVQAS